MATSDDRLALAMPVALPGEGDSAETFYGELESRIESQVSADDRLSVWTDPDDRYSGIYNMIKAATWYSPAGSPGLDGITPVASPTVYCRAWMWEFIDFRTAAGGNDVPILCVVAYTNLDEEAVRLDVTTEIGTNPSYADLSEADRAAVVDSFMSGTALLLVSVGTRLGRGLVDAAHASGYRRVDLTLYGPDTEILVPSFQFSILATIGGSLVDGHPLLDQVKGPLTPSIAPLEGGTRVRFEGSGLSAASTITFGGVAATSVRASADGKYLYGTVPAGVGTVDVTVDGTVYGKAFAYTSDVLTTGAAALQSLAIYLEDITAYAAQLLEDGLLTEDAATGLYSELDSAAFTAGKVIDARSELSGADALDSALGDLFEASVDSQQALMLAAYQAIGSYTPDPAV